jgi:hypothetical protein
MLIPQKEGGWRRQTGTSTPYGCSESEPPRGLGRVLGDTIAILIRHPEVELRTRVPLISGKTERPRRLSKVLGTAVPVR